VDGQAKCHTVHAGNSVRVSSSKELYTKVCGRTDLVIKTRTRSRQTVQHHRGSGEGPELPIQKGTIQKNGTLKAVKQGEQARRG